MHDLERRARKLKRDWQALRRDMQRVQQDHRIEEFYRVQMDTIEASIIAVPQIASCIACDSAISANVDVRAIPDQIGQDDLFGTVVEGGGGLGAYLKRIRQTEDDQDDLL